MASSVSRVLFLGLDGGTMRAFGPLFDRGLMPNLAAFWRRSVTGTLRSTTPMVTPVAWTSFLTGCTPRVHGIHEFYYLDEARRVIGANDAARIRVPTLWQHIADAGRRIVSLNLPMTYPPGPLPGLIVAGSDAPNERAAFVHCADFGAMLRAEVPDYSVKNLWKTRPRTLGELREFSRRTQALFRAQAEAAIRADASVDWTALLVHFHNLDGLQHRVWAEMAVEPADRPDPRWQFEVEECLRALDDAVGRLLELAARHDAAVIAVSDHGFGPCHALVNVNGLLQKAGLQRRLNYGTRFAYRFHRARDRWRRWRQRQAAAPPQRKSRAVVGEVGCDWKRTAAYAPYGQLSGCVYLHPDLREGGSRAERIKSEVIGMLAQVRDPERGELVFADAFDVAKRYRLDPVVEGLPDVLAPSADGYQAQAKWRTFDRRLFAPDPTLPATHYMEGVVAIDAPATRPGFPLTAELEDIAPTTLAMLGMRVPESMEGRVLHEAFVDDFGSPRRERRRAWVPDFAANRDT